jgi:hypothetical protein
MTTLTHFDTLACAAEFGQAFASAGKKLLPVAPVQPRVAP